MARDVTIHRLVRSEPQLIALAGMAREWVGRFWPLTEVLRAIERPGSLVLFMAPQGDSPQWEGVILVDIGPYQADLLYLYVSEPYRRQGVGAALFTGLVAELAKRPQIEDLMLEVRVSNEPAKKLYAQLGMESVTTRPCYYADGEDALILRYPLRPPAREQS